MWNFNKIVELDYKEKYLYHIEFDDGVEKDLDFNSYLKWGMVFQVLSDISFFKKTKIKNGTIIWANDLDIAPEAIYEKCLSWSKKK